MHKPHVSDKGETPEPQVSVFFKSDIRNPTSQIGTPLPIAPFDHEHARKISRSPTAATGIMAVGWYERAAITCWCGVIRSCFAQTFQVPIERVVKDIRART